MFPLNAALVPPPAIGKPSPNVPDPVESILPVTEVEPKRRKPAFSKRKKPRGRPRKSIVPCELCGFCQKGPESNKDDNPEELVSCSKCGNSGHPSCLEMSSEMLAIVKTYDWQCIECKTCTNCQALHDDDKMLFCDKCDRGYHTYCIGIKHLPKGEWVCKGCKESEKE
eukprot:m.43083 g.43083  ORF g.43083 m.43083 type:complete len:168 (+) comp33410_c0_seq1:692-1195(+)